MGLSNDFCSLLSAITFVTPIEMGHTSLALEREEDQISVNPVSANLLDTREASFRPWSLRGVSSCP
jgi:hypothetical protein